MVLVVTSTRNLRGGSLPYPMSVCRQRPSRSDKSSRNTFSLAVESRSTISPLLCFPNFSLDDSFRQSAAIRCTRCSTLYCHEREWQYRSYGSDSRKLILLQSRQRMGRLCHRQLAGFNIARSGNEEKMFLWTRPNTNDDQTSSCPATMFFILVLLSILAFLHCPGVDFHDLI